RKKVEYLHPKLEPIFKNTYGIMIYQEQLMSAARMLANFTLSEADVLRKAVGKKIRKLLLEQKEKLIRGCIANNVPKEIAEQFWALVEPFDRYGFNRSHAACYATIAYQTAYLKAHYPVEFMSSLLNAEADDTDRLSFLMSECQRVGIKVLPPDINKSSANFIADNGNIRFGLTGVKNVGENIIAAIIDERQKSGPFENLVSLLNRVKHKDLNKKSLESLAKCGALDSFGIERNHILSNMDDIIKFSQALKKSHDSSQMGLFGSSVSSQSLRLKSAAPASSKEKLTWEKELLGLYVSDHPLNAYRTKMQELNVKPIKELIGLHNGWVNIGGIISKVQKIITKAGKPMVFAKVEDFSDNIEVVVFSDTLSQNTDVWQENKVVLVSGKISPRDGEAKLICDKATEL
ncbi:MAG: DNA-directed DNA polymerase III alpha subunit, partial [Candidatus Giovannonibacteria bacterium GW2011_GWB1_47_6b]